MMVNKKIIPILLLLLVLSSSFNKIQPVKAAVEDLTTWTEVDAGGIQTVTSSRVTINGFNYDSNDNILYKDFTDGYFGLFKINTDFRVTSQASGGTSYAATGIIGLSTRGPTPNDFMANIESIGLYQYNIVSSTTNFNLKLLFKEANVITQTITGTYTYTVGTTYYVVLERTGLPTVTGVCTITAKIYSDAGRTTLLETLTSATAPIINYRWAYAWMSYDGGVVGPLTSAYMENFEVISRAYGQGSDGMLGGISVTASKNTMASSVIFYAEGLYWQIYQEDSLHYVAYRFSTDNCTTWSAYADFVPNGFFPNIGSERTILSFSFAQYGSKLGYIHASSAATTSIALTFRQATLSGDGTFSWDDDLQTILPVDANIAYEYPMLTYDTTGHPIVVYTKCISSPLDYSIQAIKNDYTNGTWANAADVTGQVWSYPYATQPFSFIEVVDADRLAVGSIDTTTDDLNLIIYDGASWQDPILMYDGNAMTSSIDISSIGDKVFFSFIDGGSVDTGFAIYYDISDMAITSTALITPRTSGVLYLTKSTIEQSMYCLDWAVNPDGNSVYIFDGNVWSASTVNMYAIDDPTYYTNTNIIDVMPIAIDGRFAVVTIDTYIQICCIRYVDDSSRPIVISESITNFDDTNNLYAKYRNYTLEVSILDLEDDIETIKIKITNGGIRANFLYNVTDNTFSEISGENMYTLYIGECIADLTGNYYNFTFAFAPNWNATEESDIDLGFEIKDPLFGITYGTFQTNYADTIVTLTVPSIEYSDPDSPDRININTAIVFNGQVRYRSNPGANTVVAGETRTFGNTNVGNLANITSNVVYGALWTGYVGDAQNIKAYIKPSAVGKKFTCGLYTLSGTLVAQTAEYTAANSLAGWITFTFSSPPTLTNQVYYIVIWTDDASAKIGSFSAQGTRGYFSSTYTGTLPASGIFIQDSFKYSIYCTYVSPSVTIPTAGSKFPDQSAFTQMSLYDQYNNVIATDNTIVSGDFTFSFNASSVSFATTYNVYIAMVAPDYTDAELSEPTETLITDRVIVDFLGALDTDVTAMFNTTIYCTAYYEYDHVYLSVGDSVWLNGYQLTYDLNAGLLVGYPMVATFVTAVTFDTVTDVDDHLYGLTVGDVTAWSVTVTWHEYSGTPTYTTTTSSCITTTYCETSVTYIVTISLTSTCTTSEGNTTIAGPITTTSSTSTVITTSFSLSTIYSTYCTTSGPVSCLTTGSTCWYTTTTTTSRRCMTWSSATVTTTTWCVTNYLGLTYTNKRTFSTFGLRVTCVSVLPTTVANSWTSYLYTTLSESSTHQPTVSTITTTTLSTTSSTSFVTTTSLICSTLTSPSTMTTTTPAGTSTGTVNATQVITIKTYYFYYDTVTSIDDTTTTETTSTTTNSTSTKTSVTTTDTETTSTTTSKSTTVTCTSTDTCSTYTSKTTTTTCTTTSSTTTTCVTYTSTYKTSTTTCTTSFSTSRTSTTTCETSIETTTHSSTLTDTCTTTCSTLTSVETTSTTTCTTLIETEQTTETVCETLTVTEGETTCLTTTITEETCETTTTISTETEVTCETICETSEIANTTCTTTTLIEETTTCTTTCSTFETNSTTCTTSILEDVTCTTTCDTLEFVDETSTTSCSTLVETSETTTSTCTTTTGEDTVTVNVTTTTCTTLTNSLGSTSTSTITTTSKTTTTTTAAGGGGAGGDTNILMLPITIGAILTVLFVALGRRKR